LSIEFSITLKVLEKKIQKVLFEVEFPQNFEKIFELHQVFDKKRNMYDLEEVLDLGEIFLGVQQKKKENVFFQEKHQVVKFEQEIVLESYDEEWKDSCDEKFFSKNSIL
jgi:hypothetical protein